MSQPGSNLREAEDLAGLPTAPGGQLHIPAPRQVRTPVGSDTPVRLVVSRGPDTGGSFQLTSPHTTIGRHRECDITLDDPTVSRRHAEIVQQDGHWVLRDGGSLNGTYLNRRQVDEEKLAHGDELWIGKVRFVVHATDR